MGKVGPIHKLHCNVVASIMNAHFMDRDDVRVLQSCGGRAGLGVTPTPVNRVARPSAPLRTHRSPTPSCSASRRTEPPQSCRARPLLAQPLHVLALPLRRSYSRGPDDRATPASGSDAGATAVGSVSTRGTTPAISTSDGQSTHRTVFVGLSQMTSARGQCSSPEPTDPGIAKFHRFVGADCV